jgi:uncharacterized protein YcaQ
MKTIEISLRDARRMAINAQLPGVSARFAKGKDGVVQAIESLGYIQIDTLNVIARSHHHTLWTRLPDYEPAMLLELQASDRKVFEYWGHAMSYLPIRDYRYYLPRMRSFQNPTSQWVRDQIEASKSLLKPILERIDAEGPLSSKHFGGRKGTPGGWWDWKPAKLALEVLFWRGDLMITRRDNFQKVYDLSERVLPETVDQTYPTDRELGHFLVHRSLGALGVANEREIAKYGGSNRKIIKRSMNEMIESGEVIQVRIKQRSDDHFYTLGKTLDLETTQPKVRQQVWLLSPFDNLVIQRERLHWLFNYDYVLESYVPAPKRKFGYFVLPILWGDRFVGRIDLKANRKINVLIVRSLFFEPDFKLSERFITSFATRLKKLAQFNQCTSIEIKGAVINFSELVNTLKRHQAH